MRQPGILLTLIVLLGIGCAKPGADVVGKWQLDPTSQLTGNPKTDEQLKSFASKVTVEFKADKTFSGITGIGTYEVSGHTVSMNTTQVMGIDTAKFRKSMGTPEVQARIATLSSDGKAFTLTIMGQKEKFVKAK